MKNIKKFANTLWKDESAQGATEYILLLVAVVAVVLIFKDKIRGIVEGMLSNLQGNINGAMGQ